MGRGELMVATSRAGVTVEELRQSLRHTQAVTALGQVFLEGAAPSGKPVSSTCDRTRPTRGGDREPARGLRRSPRELRAGHRAVAGRPHPDRRLRFEVRRPGRSGRIRVENADSPLNFAIAFPLRPTCPRQIGAPWWHERASARACGRGPPVDVQGLISQGSTTDNEASFRRGRYAMVSSSLSTTGSGCTGSIACAEVQAAASSAAEAADEAVAGSRGSRPWHSAGPGTQRPRACPLVQPDAHQAVGRRVEELLGGRDRVRPRTVALAVAAAPTSLGGGDWSRMVASSSGKTFSNVRRLGAAQRRRTARRARQPRGGPATSGV